MLRTSFAVLTLLALVVLPARNASAEPPPRSKADAGGDRGAPDRSPLLGRDVRAIGFVGAFGDTSDGGAGILGGGAALVRVAVFEVGVLGQGGSEMLGYGFGSGVVMAGIALQTAFGLRADVLGEFGFDRYAGVGSGASGAPPGASATVPLGGGRLGVTYLFRRNAWSHPEVGVWGVLEDDLGRRTVAYTCPAPCGASGGGPMQIAQTVGTRRFSAQLSLGAAFDLL